jgi:hypothetical protein
VQHNSGFVLQITKLTLKQPAQERHDRIGWCGSFSCKLAGMARQQSAASMKQFATLSDPCADNCTCCVFI